MSNGKKKINIRMKGFFSARGEGEKEVPYIFFHNFTACQWKLTAIRWQGLAPSAPCIINAPAGRHHNPLNLLNPMNPYTEGVSKGKKQK